MKLLVIFVLCCMVGASVSAAIASNQCPNGEFPVNCFVDPCAYTRCRDGFECVSNYCGGCNAECVPVQPLITDNGCPPGVQVVNCFADPCWAMLCGPGYVCRSNYCGGCDGECVLQEDLTA
ncbi:Hypp9069 [Branchiostoma lanceolatum]|uniref:Hypp9069 protein n=1 Tax=Branchiostoma lanceolatum TaxID=7740 RepID=A0A8K0EHT0_BRALA|nr:Hypp9069 [Branchiostoma lanceolatum]